MLPALGRRSENSVVLQFLAIAVCAIECALGPRHVVHIRKGGCEQQETSLNRLTAAPLFHVANLNARKPEDRHRAALTRGDLTAPLEVRCPVLKYLTGYSSNLLALFEHEIEVETTCVRGAWATRRKVYLWHWCLSP